MSCPEGKNSVDLARMQTEMCCQNYSHLFLLLINLVIGLLIYCMCNIEVICATSFNPGLKSLITGYQLKLTDTFHIFFPHFSLIKDGILVHGHLVYIFIYLYIGNLVTVFIFGGTDLHALDITTFRLLIEVICATSFNPGLKSLITEIVLNVPPYVDILIPVEDDKVDFSISTGSKPGDPHEQIKTEDGGIYVLEKSFNEKVTLICEIQSSPHISTSWIILDQWLVNYTNTEIEKNTKHPLYYILRSDPVLTRSNTDRYKFELEIEFNIKDGDEFGYWTCRSENELGTDQWKIKYNKNR
ncbi:hypothetical protein KUTeg_018131 [Tegillarca granosa]|uniref:Ig-like domain-containing protein n=1 Tax=Tegillarca granosa TaxID=220873 RepID=A0ABQ9EGZ8_TEGGR|nr:hypothetical protein KUTeg_018131 [Tegillarca granosa]